jgi:hypothetical protein
MPTIQFPIKPEHQSRFLRNKQLKHLAALLYISTVLVLAMGWFMTYYDLVECQIIYDKTTKKTDLNPQ